MSGAYHFELVLEPGMVRVYVSDHAFRTVNVRGARGSVALSAGGKRTVIPLRPAGEDLLAGMARLESAADVRVTVSITFPGQKTESAEYAPRPVAGTTSGSHEHEAPRR